MRLQKLLYVLLVSTLLVSCSSDDDNSNAPINPAAVFSGGFPESVGGMSMTYVDGFLTRIRTNDGVTAMFNYGTDNSSRNIKMTLKDGGAESYLDMTIGSNGFISRCVQTYNDSDDVDTWDFRYTTEGNLNYMKRSEGGNEVTTIKYTNGNITEVSMTSEDADNEYNATISYTSDKVQTAIENKGCLMFFDVMFGVDMDEMSYIYWAGLLGKATKHLPVKLVEDFGDNESETTYFQWDIQDGYAEKMLITTSWGDNEYYSFSW